MHFLRMEAMCWQSCLSALGHEFDANVVIIAIKQCLQTAIQVKHLPWHDSNIRPDAQRITLCFPGDSGSGLTNSLFEETLWSRITVDNQHRSCLLLLFTSCAPICYGSLLAVAFYIRKSFCFFKTGKEFHCLSAATTVIAIVCLILL